MKKFMIFFLLAAIGAVGLIGRADAAPETGGGMSNHPSVGPSTNLSGETAQIAKGIPAY